MNLQEALDALKMTKNLFLFDPMNGDVLGPDQLNDDNRLTLEAVEYSIEALKERCRWRKQSEEPVCDSLEDDAPVECLDMEYGIPSVRISRCEDVGLEEYWRPLDLPEEEKK